jgi:hypothetical protein
LKTIGVVKDDKKDTYQDSVTAPLSRENDDSGGGDMDGLDDDIAAAAAPLGKVLTAIPKVLCFSTSFEIWTDTYIFS